MAISKPVVANYSPAIVAAIIADYNAGKPLTDIALSCGKTVASVRAKLASLGVYKKADAKTESKKGGVTKASLVSDIAAICCGNRAALESLQAATMSDLKALLSFLVEEMRADADLPHLSESEKEIVNGMFSVPVIDDLFNAAGNPD